VTLAEIIQTIMNRQFNGIEFREWNAGSRLDNHMTDKGEVLSYSEWDQLLQTNFEKWFYIPNDKSEYGKFKVDPELIHRGGIYKDVLGSEHKFTDYQLRPNFLVAPKGMKTLDPKDSNYRGDYDNSNDSEDRFIAKGFNYHQEPEWGWCLGYFLMAAYHFRSQFASQQFPPSLLIHEIQERFVGFKDELLYSLFAGIPELTNSNGGTSNGNGKKNL
jgi:glycogen debranching enzyme